MQGLGRELRGDAQPNMTTVSGPTVSTDAREGGSRASLQAASVSSIMAALRGTLPCATSFEVNSDAKHACLLSGAVLLAPKLTRGCYAATQLFGRRPGGGTTDRLQNSRHDVTQRDPTGLFTFHATPHQLTRTRTKPEHDTHSLGQGEQLDVTPDARRGAARLIEGGLQPPFGGVQPLTQTQPAHTQRNAHKRGTRKLGGTAPDNRSTRTSGDRSTGEQPNA